MQKRFIHVNIPIFIVLQILVEDMSGSYLARLYFLHFNFTRFSRDNTCHHDMLTVKQFILGWDTSLEYHLGSARMHFNS